MKNYKKRFTLILSPSQSFFIFCIFNYHSLYCYGFWFESKFIHINFIPFFVIAKLREFLSFKKSASKKKERILRLLGSLRLNYLVDYKNVVGVKCGWGPSRERKKQKMLGGNKAGLFGYTEFFSLSIFFFSWC